MCQPSATSAMEPKAVPAPISTTIITVVSAITSQTRRSLRRWSAPRKTWSCVNASSPWEALIASLSCRRSARQTSAQIGLQNIGDLADRLASRRLAFGLKDVLTQVVLEDLAGKSRQGAPDG